MDSTNQEVNTFGNIWKRELMNWDLTYNSRLFCPFHLIGKFLLIQFSITLLISFALVSFFFFFDLNTLTSCNHN